MDESLPPYDKINVGQRIAVLRLAKGKMLAKTLADLLGITPQKLSNYESGRDMIPLRYAAKICSITGANLDYLYLGIVGGLSSDLLKAVHDAAKLPAEARRA